MDERVDRPQADYVPQSRQPAPVRRSRLRWVAWPVVLVLLVLAGAWIWSHHTPGAARHAGYGHGSATPPQPVGAATIGRGDIRIVLNELGTVTSLDTVTVMTQINGQLTQVGFKEGQVVKQGDFLAQIDPRPSQVALEQAEGTLAKDEGLLAQAKSDLQRYQTLARQDSIAQQQVSDQRFLVQQYTGTVKADQGTVDNAKLNLAYCHIVSPIDGQIGLRQVDPGNYVQTSSSSGIAVITEMQPISVLFSVPQQDVPEIIQRLRAGATLPVTAYDQANVTELATGQLATVDNQINTTTGTLQMRAIFANPDEKLYPNQFVNVRLLVDTMKNVVRVPVPAVLQGSPGTYVYVINANDTVSVRPVKLGPTDNGYDAVLSGLQPGERVVTDGTDRLADGVKITVPPTNTAATGTTGAASGAAAPTGGPAGGAAGPASPPGGATGAHKQGAWQQGHHRPTQTQPAQAQPAQTQPAQNQTTQPQPAQSQ